jgi:hypothetical protein
LKDSASNKEGKPGLAKLLISNEVFSDLRKKDVQELFIERGGLSSFVNWLSKLPDQSYPNYNLVESLLYCLDAMKISENALENNNDIIDVIKEYSSGNAKMPAL